MSGTVLAKEQREVGAPRPRMFRALGKHEPPLLVTVDSEQFTRVEIFKHDSWAATALYRSRNGRRIVCKFNRVSPIGILPMSWLGRLLARREAWFLQELNGLKGIPRSYPSVSVNGRTLKNAVAHDFVDGGPLSTCATPSRQFFDRVDELLSELHSRRIIYVDLHKQENIIVGTDGRPYLIDFQVSVQLPRYRWADPIFRGLRDADCYHAEKHRWIHGIPPESSVLRSRPAWLELHRSIGVPLRSLRRRLLVLLKIRKGDGHAATELAPEVGLRRADAA